MTEENTGPRRGPGPTASAETTDLERRVLAHERILQTLIAQMAETEPKLLRRLADTFCVPMRMVAAEHDYTETDAYAAQFIRTVVSLSNRPPQASPKAFAERLSKGAAPPNGNGVELPAVDPGVRISLAGGVWHVTKDGIFHGDFTREQDAVAAVATAHLIGAQAP
jgi:hypothetical protein